MGESGPGSEGIGAFSPAPAFGRGGDDGRAAPGLRRAERPEALRRARPSPATAGRPEGSFIYGTVAFRIFDEHVV